MAEVVGGASSAHRDAQLSPPSEPHRRYQRSGLPLGSLNVATGSPPAPFDAFMSDPAWSPGRGESSTAPAPPAYAKVSFFGPEVRGGVPRPERPQLRRQVGSSPYGTKNSDVSSPTSSTPGSDSRFALLTGREQSFELRPLEGFGRARSVAARRPSFRETLQSPGDPPLAENTSPSGRFASLVPRLVPVLEMRGTASIASLDSVKGAEISTLESVAYPPEPREYPFPEPTVARLLTHRPATLFGLRAPHRPLWLIALGSVGNVAYGMGTVVLERAIWPFGARHLPELGLGPDAGPAAAGGAGRPPPGRLKPDYNRMWGGRTGGLAMGGVFTGFGMLLAATSACMLWRDNRKLMRRNHVRSGAAGEPSLFWPNFYLSLNGIGIALLVSHRILIAMTSDNDRPDWVWISTLPGVIGSTIFSITQAQSASGSELYHGKMPLWRRDVLGAVARAGVAMYAMFGAMAGTPGFNPYLRELTRLVAMTSFTMACFLQLTTARQVANARLAAVGGAPELTSWDPAVRWALWLVGRTLIGFGPNLFERGYYTLHYAGTEDNNTGINRHNYREFGRHIFSDVAAGTSMTTAGVLFDLLATGLMRRDAIFAGEPRWSANALMASAVAGSVCMVAYRGVIEFAKDRLSQSTLWVSTFPGMVGAALLFATVPILFSFSELSHGDIPIAQRDRLTRVMRALAGMGFPLWCAMAAIHGFNPFGREAVLIGASLCFQLANALPTTTTRRGRPQFAFPRTPGLQTPAPLRAGGRGLGA